MLAEAPVLNVIELTTKGIEWTFVPEFVLMELYCVLISAPAPRTIGIFSAYAITVTNALEITLRRAQRVCDANVLKDMVMLEPGGYDPVTRTAAPSPNWLRVMSTRIGTIAGAAAVVGPWTAMCPCDATVPPEKRISTAPAAAVPVGMLTPESVNFSLEDSVQPSPKRVETVVGETTSVPKAAPLAQYACALAGRNTAVPNCKSNEG